MKIEVTEEKIKSYHKDACQLFKTRIEKDFPALFEATLEVGKWYKYKNNYDDCLMVWNDGKNTYGFFQGDFGNGWAFTEESAKVPATDEEVSTALIAEAKRRGFKKGVNFKHNKISYPNLLNNVCEITSNNFEFKDGSMLCDGWDIFKEGLWAEIIKEEPVYEWQYVFYIPSQKNYSLTHAFYKSKKDFLKSMPNLKPLHKVKESKRIRESENNFNPYFNR